MSTRITEITRQAIFDEFTVRSIDWWGRLDDVSFLSRIFNLATLPSSDPRYRTAAKDIHKHRIVNPEDWSDYWVFDDDRFNLRGTADDVFLEFLCETVHPAVRPDTDEARALISVFNDHLENDGFEIYESSSISGRPVFKAREVESSIQPIMGFLEESLNPAAFPYLSRQISRIKDAVSSHPESAIGESKELVEGCCKSILKDRGVSFQSGINLQKLVKLVSKELKLTPDDIPETAKASEKIRILLNNLASIVHIMSELRNAYGTGHGREFDSNGLTSRHAKLSAGAAITLVVFLAETHRERE